MNELLDVNKNKGKNLFPTVLVMVQNSTHLEQFKERKINSKDRTNDQNRNENTYDK